MYTATHRLPSLRGAAVCLAITMAACGGSKPEAALVEPPIYFYGFGDYRSDGSVQGAFGQLGGVVEHAPSGETFQTFFDFGRAGVSFTQGGEGGRAQGEAHGTGTGVTYYTFAQSPQGNISAPDERIGGITWLFKNQTYRKDEDDATLELEITSAEVQLADSSGFPLLARECARIATPLCGQTMRGFVDYYFEVFQFGASGELAIVTRDEGHSRLELHGFQGFSRFSAPVLAEGSGAVRPVWLESDFEYDPDADGSGQQILATVKLKQPKLVRLDLSKIPKGSEFQVREVLISDTFDHRGRESSVRAFLRDPESATGLGGASLRARGLTAVPGRALAAPSALPSRLPAEPAPPCAAPDSQAGTLQFSDANYSMPEWSAAASPVLVTRTGGSRGRVSVKVDTVDGTALAGRDYTATSGHIVFGEGDSQPRLVPMRISHDRVAEPDKSLRLKLSAPGGCATLGANVDAELTILDDDRPVAPGTLTLGGTVTGLAGSGLVLDNNGLLQAIAGNGAFTFAEPQPDLLAYNVTIAVQPTQPTQLCSVTRGSGTFAGANVTDVAVVCVAPPPVGGLDTGFGASGKVFSNSFVPADTSSSLALQSDGKLLVVGSKGGDFAIARFNADGNPDSSFGIRGLASAGFVGGIDDKARAVATQADGRVVVAGYTATSLGSGTRRFGLARLNADGTLDTSFGTGGLVRTELGAASDEALSLAVRPDGRIVVAGLANTSSVAGVASLDYALAQYHGNGTLDTSFGSGGKVTISVNGGMGAPQRLLLLGDGRIVVSGGVGVAPNLNIINHTAVLRFNANGSLDAGFGSAGQVIHPLVGGTDVLAQGDGKLLIVGRVSAGLVDLDDLAVLRLNPDGSVDSSFGSRGVATVGFGTASPDSGRALALQADGRIVVAGHNSGAGLGLVDFKIARLNTNGSLDAGFGTGGRLSIDFFAGDDLAHALRIQPDGRIVVAGSARNGNLGGAGLIRINP